MFGAQPEHAKIECLSGRPRFSLECSACSRVFRVFRVPRVFASVPRVQVVLLGVVSFIRYYVPFQQQQHPVFLYVIHTEIISFLRHNRAAVSNRNLSLCGCLLKAAEIRSATPLA